MDWTLPAALLTSVDGVSGLGHSGQHQGRLLFNDRSSLSMVISVVPLDQIDPVIVGIRQLLLSSSSHEFKQP